MGEKETATAETLGAGSAEEADARGRTGNLVQMDDDRGVARATNLNSSKSNIYREHESGDEEVAAGRVKGSKSNSSERSSVQDFEKASEATTVKSGKSNSSDRWQDGDPTDDNTDDDDNPNRVKSSKSNTSDRFVTPEGDAPSRATTVKSSKSNSSE